MTVHVRWSAQVAAYVRGRAPEARKALRRALQALAGWDGRADPPRIRFLEDDLVGYLRLRIGPHRVIFREVFEDDRRVILCVFAGPRSSIYETFAELLLDEFDALSGSE